MPLPGCCLGQSKPFGGPAALGEYMQFVLVHRIPGRARLRAGQSFGMKTAVKLADSLEAVAGMEGVRVNPRVGSVLLVYSSEEALLRACELLGCTEAIRERHVPAVPQPEADEKPSLFPFFRSLWNEQERSLYRQARKSLLNCIFDLLRKEHQNIL